jgi:glycosyltransferase involved in cell wall biosynthesis
VRLGFVVPRYGPDVLGGAETAARLLAQRLAGRAGWSVDVFTTCARDAATWEDVYPPGREVVQGVAVHRFRSRSGRGDGFAAARAAALHDPARTSRSVADAFVEQLGPVCPDAVDAAETSPCDLVAFGPYLYHPVVTGVPRLGRRAVLHGAAHDEPEIRLPVYRDVFEGAGALVHWSEVEQRLTASLFGRTATKPQIVLGLGVERGDGDPGAARRAIAVGDEPYFLCLGRTLDAKGTTMLARYFAAARERRGWPARIVFAGPVVDPPPELPGVVVAGPVDERTKWGLLRGATALVSPSPLESLSIVLLEAWSVGIPVVVNGACAVTVDLCGRAGGGCWFEGFTTFEVALDRMLRDAQLRERLARAGRSYVERHFSWAVVEDRYARFLEQRAAA